jgi:hypothetical protein
MVPYACVAHRQERQLTDSRVVLEIILESHICNLLLLLLELAQSIVNRLVIDRSVLSHAGKGHRVCHTHARCVLLLRTRVLKGRKFAQSLGLLVIYHHLGIHLRVRWDRVFACVNSLAFEVLFVLWSLRAILYIVMDYPITTCFVYVYSNFYILRIDIFSHLHRSADPTQVIAFTY